MKIFITNEKVENKEFTKIHNFLRERSPSEKQELISACNDIVAIFGDVIVKNGINRITSLEEGFLKIYLSEQAEKNFLGLTKELVIFPEKLTPYIDVPTEDLVKVKNLLALKMGYYREFLKIEEEYFKESSYLLTKCFSEEDLEETSKLVNSISEENIFDLEVNSDLNLKNDIEEAVLKNYTVECFPIDSKVIKKIVLSRNKIEVVTNFVRNSKIYTWNIKNIIIEIPKERIKEVFRITNKIETLPRKIGSYGDNSELETSWREWLCDDISKLIEEAGEISEDAEFGNVSLKAGKIYIFDSELSEDASLESRRKVYNNEEFVEFIVSESLNGESFNDFCYNTSSDFWFDCEMTDMFKTALGSEAEENNFVVSGTNVNWRNSCFDDIVEFGKSPKELMKKITSGLNDYRLEVFSHFRENKMTVMCYHHDCPMGASYTIIPYNDFVSSWDLNFMPIMRAALKKYTKDAIRSHYIKEGKIDINRLKLEIALEFEVESKEEFLDLIKRI